MNKIVMFDLDGTLIDSVGGIANSVNAIRIKCGLAPLPEKVIESYTGNGSRDLLTRSLAGEKIPCSFEEALQEMVSFYAANPLVNTRLYPGTREGLAALKEAGFYLAIVSNKPQEVSENILAGLEIRTFFSDNLSGGKFPLKPAPDALLFLMEKYDVSKENAWMAGDNHTDINAANAAGIRSIFCRYGFGSQDGTVPTCYADSFGELAALLQKA